MELAGVVVEGQHEARGDERRFVRRAHDDPSVRLVGAVAVAAGRGLPRPRPAPRHEAQPVRADRPDQVLDHEGTLPRSYPATVRASIAAPLASVVSLVTLTAAAPAAASDAQPRAQVLVLKRNAKVAIRAAPASKTLAVAKWKTPFGSVRRLRVVERRGDWFAVESDVLGNGVVGWVPKTAAIRVRSVRHSVEADLSARLVTLREDGRVVFRRRVDRRGRFADPERAVHISDQISGRRWGLGCCIVVFSGSQPRLPVGWNGGDRLAAHGRSSRSERIGSPASAGCLHATERDAPRPGAAPARHPRRHPSITSRAVRLVDAIRSARAGASSPSSWS